ncbi:unnamed protein product [Urochloa decumbens]|uniref:Disease resistance protein At4g27190-like leucine-rich repeats domain-containing protein n=1 Tax=Urochloa decumbens TaxID=240449 RepID=A0ABC9CDX7_9POAL
MRTEVIKADTIDAAAELILDELKKDNTIQSSTSRENVICFDGWDGLGASAVLQTVAQHLATASDEQRRPTLDGVRFDQIIQIDCSKWESRRAVQRAIAEQLKLPARVIEMLDKQDEEDDLHGLAKGSRTEIPQVVTEIYQCTQNHRELIVIGARDWNMGPLQGRLPNIRKLRVTESTISCSGHSRNELFSGMNKMVLLDFSGNSTTQDFQNLSGVTASSNFLETATINDGGCIGIQKICFRGCAKLNNLLLSGLFEDLHILDLSGTAIKTLDLRAMIARNLDELFMDGCEQLCAVLWPLKDNWKSYLTKLHIDTSQSAVSLLAPKEESTIESSTTTVTSWESLSIAHGSRVPSKFSWFISAIDARLLRSLAPFEKYFDDKGVHMEISSLDITFGSGKDNEAVVKSRSSNSQRKENSTYTNVAVSFKDSLLLQESQGDSGASIYPMVAQKCYMHLQDRQPRRTGSLQGEDTSITIPNMICYNAFILHVHDSLSMTSIPGPAPALSSTWRRLRWCRVERCPKLECVFTTPQFPKSSDMIIFYFLKVLWASELPKARYIWNWSTPLAFQLESGSFEDLKLLHLDLCPRLIHVLPLAMSMVKRSSLGDLVTLEILWCGSLKVVFPLYTDADGSRQLQEQPITRVEFRNLKRNHLHELPKLRGICGSWRMYTPELESVKIRGCWSLKQLPIVSGDRIKKVKCDCEKEWWEKLEWDMDSDHHPSLYQPTHSRYYKKTLLRGSVLI